MTGGLIIVVAGEADVQARALPARLPDLDVRLLTPADLSRPGWEFRPGRAGGSAVVAGEQIPTAALEAVLVRLPWVSTHDLPHIDAADRAYVSAEMSAFLLAWLVSLPCPVINRPCTTCLAGPLWRPERWARLAAAVGLAVVPIRRAASGDRQLRQPVTPAQGITATVAGDRCLGVDDPAVVALLRRLARAAGAEVLAVRLSDTGPDARFLAASPWPDIADDAVLHAVLETAGVLAGVERAVLAS